MVAVVCQPQSINGFITLRSFYECVLLFADYSVHSTESSLNSSLLNLSEPLTLSKLFLPSYMYI